MHKFPANFAKNHEVCKDFALSFFSVEQLVFVIPFYMGFYRYGGSCSIDVVGIVACKLCWM